uniref:Uncharacterized protein n=1 Tax=Haptolina brevifila TaxID=156173 RepID=A0A7S2H3N0_9EUKA|mmetsp:Transcript_50949/g.101324  ORF Transcript_50949/g.101324 Transcript_50949/m.101324 type:complete len:277 (+) Transcript_50949:67-897(+)
MSALLDSSGLVNYSHILGTPGDKMTYRIDENGVLVKEPLPKDYKPSPLNVPAESYPEDELVTLDDGRVLPLKKTVCVPKGNKVTPTGPRVKLTAKLRKETEEDEMLLRNAAQEGWPLNLKEQIEKGVDVNCRGGPGWATALICGSLKGNYECMKMLLDAGANPHLANSQCDTPLTVSCKWGHTDIVKLLLDQGVDPRMKNNSPVPVTPYDIAKQHGWTAIMDLILECWQKLDMKDAKKKEVADKAAQRAAERHKQDVSRAAEARRAAAAAGAVSVS